MEQSPGLIHPQYPHHVYQLRKSLYGFKQAPCEWFKKLTNFLITLGFQGSKTDPSFFKYDNHIPYFLLIYVDGILLISPNHLGINTIIKSLHFVFSMKDLGQAHFFLGIELFPNSTCCLPSQTKYITNILKWTHMENCKPTSTPCSSSSLSHDFESTDPFLYRAQLVTFNTSRLPYLI